MSVFSERSCVFVCVLVGVRVSVWESVVTSKKEKKSPQKINSLAGRAFSGDLSPFLFPLELQ